MQKPSIPKGTRDFLPHEVAKRDYIFKIIKETFIKYGYKGIHTPVMELLSTLTGKYGEEGEKLLFKVLNNGDFLAKADQDALAAKDSTKLVSSISKRGLRYDLTVPFARYVVQHRNEISLPFKRYAIEPVWRADRPQKGRYQEFYQCDVDFVGTDSLMCEAELVTIIDEVFTRLGMNVTIMVNHRKVLQGITDVSGLSDHFMTWTIAIDKLDKIGKEKVIDDLVNRGLDQVAVEKSLELIQLTSLDALSSALAVGHKQEIKFNGTLARGLNYYTGSIFEVVANDVQMGSILGGGRYDDLTGVFGMSGVSGVGVSFGAERIYDVMEELELWPTEELESAKAIILAMDEDAHRYAFAQASLMRKAGIAIDIYPEVAKFKKQMKYANQGGYPYVVIIGTEEVEKGVLSVKDMKEGSQTQQTTQALIDMWS